MNQNTQEYKTLAEIKTRATRAISQGEIERDELLSQGLNEGARCCYHSTESFRRVLEWIDELNPNIEAEN